MLGLEVVRGALRREEGPHRVRAEADKVAQENGVTHAKALDHVPGNDRVHDRVEVFHEDPVLEGKYPLEVPGSG